MVRHKKKMAVMPLFFVWIVSRACSLDDISECKCDCVSPFFPRPDVSHSNITLRFFFFCLCLPGSEMSCSDIRWNSLMRFCTSRTLPALVRNRSIKDYMCYFRAAAGMKTERKGPRVLKSTYFFILLKINTHTKRKDDTKFVGYISGTHS